MDNYSNTTSVVEFGDSESDADFYVIEVDSAMMVDGELPSDFPPNSEVLLLVHHADDTTEIRHAETGGGSMEYIGTVSRQNSVELSFAPDVSEMELPHIPTGLVSVSSSGNETSLIMSNGSRTLKASTLPAIVTVEYNYVASQYKYITPNVSGELPVDLYFDLKGNS